MRFVHWRMAFLRDEGAYLAAARAYHDAINAGSAEWHADKLAHIAGTKFRADRAKENTAC